MKHFYLSKRIHTYKKAKRIQIVKVVFLKIMIISLFWDNFYKSTWFFHQSFRE